MGSIFDIITWNSSTTYSKNDIVKWELGSAGRTARRYWYALSSVPVNVEPSTTSGQAYWGGMKSSNGKDRPHFLWTPSYQTSSNFAPIVKVVKFGDGYEQRISPNINNNLLKLDVRFELRSTAETQSILHFLHARAGVEPFIFEPPEPLNSIKDQFFVCRNWNNTFNFFNNQTLSVTFDQTVAY